MEATEEVDILEREIDALTAAKKLKIEKVEAIARVLLGARVERMATAELRRDVMIFARNSPEEFLHILDNSDLDLYNDAQKAFDEGYLTQRNGGREVYYNMGKNKKRMLMVPFEESPVDAVAAFLKTDEGIDFLKVLEKKLELA